jgi:hypothetical protein
MKRVSAAAMLTLLVSVFCLTARAQGFTPVEARISSVSGSVLFSGSTGQPRSIAQRGLALAPGSVLDTTGGGKAVVALTDGSIVIVQPDSVVTFKDFQQAGSLRELFEITLGQVRVRINHFAGRPNPYRMNSPTASIAVRGTEFTITVDRTGETRVVVFEGAVEVTSLADPSRHALIESGQGILVAPGFDLQLFTPSTRDLEDRASSGDRDRSGGRSASGSAPAGAGGPVGQGPGAGSPQQDADQQTPRAQAGTYQRYIAGLESLNGLPLLLRYNAVAEAYLDSAENPAYAALFRQAEGRAYLLPSLQGTPETLETAPGSGASGILPATYALLSQVSTFVPVDKGKFVIGGSATGSFFNNVTGTSTGRDVDPGALGPIPSVGALTSSNTSNSRFFGGSLLLASKTGIGSFGLQVETLKGTGSLTATTPDPDSPGKTLQDSLTNSSILQTRLTLGFRRQIGSRGALGIFTRYGFIDAKNQDILSTLAGTPQPLSQTTSPGHTAEIGIRFRGVITPKLSYGLETAWLGLSLRDTIAAGGVPASLQTDRAHRESAGFGFSYVPGRRTAFVGDFAFGLSNIGAVRNQAGNSLLLQNGTANSHFESLHLAVQREIGSRFFVLASFVNVWQGSALSYSVFPAGGGTAQPVSDSLFSTSPGFYLSPPHVSDFGGGMRLSKDLLAQYIFSTDYGFSASSHTLMLRYTFHFSRD